MKHLNGKLNLLTNLMPCVRRTFFEKEETKYKNRYKSAFMIYIVIEKEEALHKPTLL